jgi:hypothetical protein
MRIISRLKKIETEIQSQSRIPVQDKFVFIGPDDTEEEEEVKIEKHLEKLRQQYGDDVSRQDIEIMRLIYDKPAEASKDELIERDSLRRK